MEKRKKIAKCRFPCLFIKKKKVHEILDKTQKPEKSC